MTNLGIRGTAGGEVCHTVMTQWKAGVQDQALCFPAPKLLTSMAYHLSSLRKVHQQYYFTIKTLFDFTVTNHMINML